MAKATFRRLAKKDPVVFILSLNFVIAGLFFVIGSVLFWPGIDDEGYAETMGAALFLIGSAMYMVGAMLDHNRMSQELSQPETVAAANAFASLDSETSTGRVRQESFIEMTPMHGDEPAGFDRTFMLTYDSENVDAEPEIEIFEKNASGEDILVSVHKASVEELRRMTPGDRNTILYKRFIVKCQQLNSLLYSFGGLIFVVGSVMFFPQVEGLVPNKIIHGLWLFIAGSAVSMTGAYVGDKTAQELAITAPLEEVQNREEQFQEHEKRLRHMWWLTDEELTMRSCRCYVVGSISFIVGSAWFFPAQGEFYWKLATVVFTFGSFMYFVGATMDYMCLERSYFEGDSPHNNVSDTPTQTESRGLNSSPLELESTT